MWKTKGVCVCLCRVLCNGLRLLLVYVWRLRFPMLWVVRVNEQGSFAIYLEPWHADIFSFLDLRKNHGNELERARDLFLGLWVPDLFMERVESNGHWSLLCPKDRKRVV